MGNFKGSAKHSLDFELQIKFVLFLQRLDDLPFNWFVFFCFANVCVISNNVYVKFLRAPFTDRVIYK